MGLTLVTGPAAEPLTVPEAKEHLRLETTEDDNLVLDYIEEARDYTETFTRRALITQTWDVTFEGFPGERDDGTVDRSRLSTVDRYAIEVPKPPLVSVTHVKYYDTAGVLQTISSANYIVDTSVEPGRIVPIDGYSWPTSQWRPNAVTVRIVCGYGAEGRYVPPKIRHAIRVLLHHAYEDRSQFVTGAIVNELPTVSRLLWSARVLSVA